MAIREVSENEQLVAISEPTMSKYARKRAKRANQKTVQEEKQKYTLDNQQTWIALNTHINNTPALWNEDNLNKIAKSFMKEQGLNDNIQAFFNQVGFEKFKTQVANVKFVVSTGIKLLAEDGSDKQWLELIAQAVANDVGREVSIEELPNFYGHGSLDGVLLDIGVYKRNLDNLYQSTCDVQNQQEPVTMAMGEACKDPKTLINETKESIMSNTENYQEQMQQPTMGTAPKMDQTAANTFAQDIHSANNIDDNNVWPSETMEQATMGLNGQAEQTSGQEQDGGKNAFAGVKEAAAKASQNAGNQNVTQHVFTQENFFDKSFSGMIKDVGQVALLGTVAGAASYCGLRLAEKAFNVAADVFVKRG